MRTVNLATLVEDTGEAVRTLQYWSDLQILRPQPTSDRRGRGRAREYAAEPYFGERKWACIASALNKLRLPVSEIDIVVGMMRRYGRPDFSNSWQSEREAIDLFEASPFYSAIKGDRDVLVLVGKSRRDGVDSTDLCWLPTIPKDMIRQDDPAFMQLTAQFMREHAGAHCLNLTKILEPLRNVRQKEAVAK